MKRCKLCLNERELKNSHIIPECFYKPLYDDKHRLHVVSTYKRCARPTEQKGLRERMLCSECETKLSGWETHACGELNGDKVKFGDCDHRIVMDVDYKKFKLFELSILWRVSVSNHQFFEKARLKPHEEKELRFFISEEYAPKADKYGSIKFALLGDHGERQLDYIFEAEPINEKNDAICMAFGGIKWAFVIDGRLAKKCTDWFLQKNGALPIQRDTFSDEVERQKSFARKLQEMNRWPRNDLSGRSHG